MNCNHAAGRGGPDEFKCTKAVRALFVGRLVMHRTEWTKKAVPSFVNFTWPLGFVRALGISKT